MLSKMTMTISRIILITMAFSIMTIYIETQSRMTFSKMTLNIITLSITI
jgi:hypothetical protein